MPRSFKSYVENMDRRDALDFVFTKLRLPVTNPKNDEDLILSMPLRGYGKEALRAILHEPTIRELPNFQTDILSALTKPDTTVGALVNLLTYDDDTDV